jgi:hypothetical protein
VLLVLVVPASARALTGNGRAIAIHAACHLPHPDERSSGPQSAVGLIYDVV